MTNEKLRNVTKILKALGVQIDVAFAIHTHGALPVNIEIDNDTTTCQTSPAEEVSNLVFAHDGQEDPCKQEGQEYFSDQAMQEGFSSQNTQEGFQCQRKTQERESEGTKNKEPRILKLNI